jgi:serine/threonine protein kinase
VSLKGDLAIGIALSEDGLRLVARLGAGGWGVVYLAHELPLGRDVAVKAIRHELAHDQSSRARFERERMLLAGVRHVNVLPIYRCGEADGQLYFVMPFARRGTLRRLVGDGRVLAPESAAWLLWKAAEGVAALHGARILHRDIKPDNILLDGDAGGVIRDVWLTDLGLGCWSHEAGDARDLGLGTSRYMAPERRRGHDAGPAADVYALGLVLYEALTGRLPGTGLGGPLPRQSPDGDGLTDKLWRICARATADDPADRHCDARELADELGRLPGVPPAAVHADPAYDGPPRGTGSLTFGEPSGPGSSPVRPHERVRPGRRRRAVVAALLAVVVPLAAATGWMVSRSAGGEEPASKSASSVAMYEVCADTLELRASPAPLTDTKSLGTLRHGDRFDVLYRQSATWWHGYSPRLGQQGWAIRQNGPHIYLRPSCGG